MRVERGRFHQSMERARRRFRTARIIGRLAIALLVCGVGPAQANPEEPLPQQVELTALRERMCYGEVRTGPIDGKKYILRGEIKKANETYDIVQEMIPSGEQEPEEEFVTPEAVELSLLTDPKGIIESDYLDPKTVGQRYLTNPVRSGLPYSRTLQSPPWIEQGIRFQVNEDYSPIYTVDRRAFFPTAAYSDMYGAHFKYTLVYKDGTVKELPDVLCSFSPFSWVYMPLIAADSSIQGTSARTGGAVWQEPLPPRKGTIWQDPKDSILESNNQNVNTLDLEPVLTPQ